MMNIIIELLNLYNDDIKVQKNFNKLNHRFKCSQRAINQLKKHDISVETPALINPSINTTRKFFLEIIAKTKLQEKEIEKKIKTPFERIVEERKAKRSKIMKNFMGKEWIHTDLQEPEELQSKTYEFSYVDLEKYDEKDFKEKLLFLIKNNARCSYSEAIERFLQFRNDRSVKRDYSIIAQVDRIIAKSEKSEAAKVKPQISTNFGTYMKKSSEKSENNAISKTARYRINTMAEGMTYNQSENMNSKQKLDPQEFQNFTRLNIGLIAGIETEKPKEVGMSRPKLNNEQISTTVTTQISATTEKKDSSIEIKQANPMESMEAQERENLDAFKKEKKADIEQIHSIIEGYNSEVENHEEILKLLNSDKEQLDEQYQDQVGLNKEFENDIKKKDKYLSAILQQDFEQNQVKENQKLNDEIKDLEKILDDTKTDLHTKLTEAKKDYEEKTSEIQYLEEKIEYFEENYPNLVTNLKGALEQRNALSSEYEALPKDLKREHLTEMVTHITMKTKAHRKLTKNTTDMIEAVKKEVEDNNKNIKMGNTSIECTIKGEKKKDTYNNQLLDSLEKIKKVFDDTSLTLYEIIDIKTQNKVIEDKVRELEKMRYDENNDALRQELNEMKNE